MVRLFFSNRGHACLTPGTPHSVPDNGNNKWPTSFTLLCPLEPKEVNTTAAVHQSPSSLYVCSHKAQRISESPTIFNFWNSFLRQGLTAYSGWFWTQGIHPPLPRVSDERCVVCHHIRPEIPSNLSPHLRFPYLRRSNLCFQLFITAIFIRVQF